MKVEIWDRTKGLSFVEPLFRRCVNEASAKPCSAAEARLLVSEIGANTEKYVVIQFLKREIEEPLLLETFLSGFSNRAYTAVCVAGMDMNFSLMGTVAMLCQEAMHYILFPIECSGEEAVLILCVYTSDAASSARHTPMKRAEADNDIDAIMHMVQSRRRT